MALTFGFYNSVDHDRRYSAIQFGQIFDGIIKDGIYATYGKAMVVKASDTPNDEVIVQPGRAWFNHTWSYNDANLPITAELPEVVLDRIDTLVLDVDASDASRTNSFIWVKGTPTSGTPVRPTLIRTVMHNQYPLCDVYRHAGTTTVYPRDITNRVGTSDCPFVTGVLQGISIDDLLSQWDNEFHTWENSTKNSFESWMLNQQSVYTSWWNQMRSQMTADLSETEAWVQSIKDVIGEEAASHLQAEIDELKEQLTHGSYITITTTDTTLYNRTVTVIDQSGRSVSGKFDGNGVCELSSVPLTGVLTISATDGSQTATTTLNAPYFGNYNVSLSLFSATVNIVGTPASLLGGKTVVVTKGSTTITSVVLDANARGTAYLTETGEYTFTCEY